jgi:ribosomal protein L7/L12
LKEIRVFDICIKLSEIQHNRILDAYKHVGKVQAIKDLRLMTDLGLKDAKDVVEQYFIPLSDRLRHDTGARSLGDLLRDQINGG